ncbi:esterase-like activity of phytase family protein [Flavisolibacter nicotianae]|uniref:esterase-like activity of phytase family protein n=1 Tax=Flavisolibacter nicotianae TaxID=2364882 RepID=UPI0013C4BC3A|nr:esterase-like activity of phytase family protein [Flavisolibacter nicotianae]
MNFLLRLLCLFSFLAITGAGCTSQKKSAGQPIRQLKLVNEFDLPHHLQFHGTTVGGLSSIDYVPSEDVYHLVCDDRSDLNAARFYTAKIRLGDKGIDTVQLLNVTTLLQKNGKPYPNKKEDSLHVPDPEALRFNRSNGTLVWSSEGERIVRGGKVILTDPSINIIDRKGQWLDSLPLPANMHMRATENGPRQNGVFEGLAFTDDNKTLFVSVEEPLYEDGPRAGLKDTSGWIRLIKYNMTTREPVAQYAYRIDPVVQEPISAGTFIVNGVPDILAVNDHQLLITERSFSTGRLTCNIRIYLAELKDADDISGVVSLQKSPVTRPVQKKLVLNMDSLGRWIDNVEGATFGPRLPNGHRSLLFVTDDNFAPFERTQFFLFDVQ